MSARIDSLCVLILRRMTTNVPWRMTSSPGKNVIIEDEEEFPHL